MLLCGGDPPPPPTPAPHVYCTSGAPLNAGMHSEGSRACLDRRIINLVQYVPRINETLRHYVCLEKVLVCGMGAMMNSELVHQVLLVVLQRESDEGP